MLLLWGHSAFIAAKESSCLESRDGCQSATCLSNCVGHTETLHDQWLLPQTFRIKKDYWKKQSASVRNWGCFEAYDFMVVSPPEGTKFIAPGKIQKHRPRNYDWHLRKQLLVNDRIFSVLWTLWLKTTKDSSLSAILASARVECWLLLDQIVHHLFKGRYNPFSSITDHQGFNQSNCLKFQHQMTVFMHREQIKWDEPRKHSHRNFEIPACIPWKLSFAFYGGGREQWKHT